jgi:hypothetical protein
VKRLAKGQRPYKWQGQDLNPGLSERKPKLSSVVLTAAHSVYISLHPVPQQGELLLGNETVSLVFTPLVFFFHKFCTSVMHSAFSSGLLYMLSFIHSTSIC